MRIRTFLFLLGATVLFYRLLPTAKKVALRDRLQGLGQALFLAIVLFWVWMLLTLLWDNL